MDLQCAYFPLERLNLLHNERRGGGGGGGGGGREREREEVEEIESALLLT